MEPTAEGTINLQPDEGLQEQNAAEALLMLQDVDCPSIKAHLDKSIQVTTDCFQMKFSRTVNSRNVGSITGICSIELLNDIVSSLEQSNAISSKCMLDIHDKVVMTMMMLKHALTFDFLSHLFGCSPTTCSTAIRSTITSIASDIQGCMHWSSKEEIQNNMPMCFEHFSKTRVVLDCTEISISTPKCLRCNISTYSHYKKCHTIKYMVGVSPGGIITFLSRGYGGRASDKAIFDQSEIVNLLTPDDHIMVDKGFLIERSCEPHHITIIRPPFLRKESQFSKEDALKTKKIAAARVHVERAIQRIKLFKVLSQRMPWHLVPHADHILIIASALCNLSAPILADDKFL